MDGLDKIALLNGEMAVETAEEVRHPPTLPPNATCSHPSVMPHPITSKNAHKQEAMPVYQAALPGGKRISLLKTMLTSACERNCNYCSFRCGRDFRRVTFQPDELAATFMKMHQAGITEGLFLSSGIAGSSIRTQDRLNAAAEILRNKYAFSGYLHLKIMPGAEHDQYLRAMQLADRVSVNLEAPTVASLGHLAPQKLLAEELLQPLRVVEHIRQTQPPSQGWSGRWPSSCTQFVVGAVDETDRELLNASQYLTNSLKLRRAYYSKFSPIPGTPLENNPCANPWRTHHLYQAFFLLRDYGFSTTDLPFDPTGSLPLSSDPKLAWAEAHLKHAPVEINRAEMVQLLKIPGIGPVAARAILSTRRKQPLRCIEDLLSLGIRANRAAPYILLAGRRPISQPTLF